MLRGAERACKRRPVNQRLERVTGKAHHEHTTGSWHVPHRQAPAFFLKGPPCDGAAEAQPTPVEATLRERLEHLFGEPGREAATVVLNVDVGAVSHCICLKRYLDTRVSEFESVLKRVHQRGQQRIEISGKGDAGVRFRRRKFAPVRAGAERRDALCVGNASGERKSGGELCDGGLVLHRFRGLVRAVSTKQ